MMLVEVLKVSQERMNGGLKKKILLFVVSYLKSWHFVELERAKGSFTLQIRLSSEYLLMKGHCIQK